MKLSEQLAADLRKQIVEGVLKDGSSLGTEAHIIEKYGLSRPSVREALRLLESESLITITRGARAIKVRLPDVRLPARHLSLLLRSRGVTLKDAYGARLMVEPAAARAVAEKAYNTAPAILEKIIYAEESLAGGNLAFLRLTVQFHETIIELSGNKTIHTMMSSLSQIFLAHSEVLVDISLKDRDFFLRGVQAHRKLVELIRSNRPMEAEEYWRSHLRAIEEKYFLLHEFDQGVDIIN